ncbi:MAG: hypothetical protein JWN23_473 [Rhodocyclales bacterium]|nr:hypothetical protein [Rhodocyclales bacterium]
MNFRRKDAPVHVQVIANAEPYLGGDSFNKRQVWGDKFFKIDNHSKVATLLRAPSQR